MHHEASVAVLLPDHFPISCIHLEHKNLFFCIFWIFLLASHLSLGSWCNIRQPFTRPWSQWKVISSQEVGRCIVLFFHLEKLLKKMLLDIFKLFPSGLRDAIAPHFHPIEKHWCHQYVENVFIEDTTLQISKIASILKCIHSFPTCTFIQSMILEELQG